MSDRRRWPRQQIAWSVRLLIDEGRTIAATAMDASLHGLRLAVYDIGASPAIREGARCCVEVYLPGGEARFVRHGEVRHFGEHGVGLVIAEPLPAALVPPSYADTRHTSAASAKPSSRQLASLRSMLRSVTLATLHR